MNSPAPHPSFFGRLGRRIVAFVAAPASPRPLAFLRMGVTGVLLLQAFMIAPDVSFLYGPRGAVQWAVSDPWLATGVPRLWWFTRALAPLDLEPATVVRGIFALYAISLACLFIGWRTRVAAVLAWLTHLSLKQSAAASIYGVDHFANIALFYMMWMPVGDYASLDVQSGRRKSDPSPAARLSLRVLQLHLCVVYFSSGLEKAVGLDWWTGDVIWYSLMRPDLSRFDFSWLTQAEWLTVLLAWGTLILEIGYPLYIWLPWTRKAWAWGIVGMHAGIAVCMGLVTFSGVMISLNVAATLVPVEPSPVPAENKLPRSEPAPAEELATAAAGPVS
jgi:hypothetical protein